MKFFCSILFVSLSAFLFAQDRSDWFEFYLPWTDSSKTITDMSGYLDAPAGKYGFLQTTPDGHFKFENKAQNERFVGVVNVAIANYPTKQEAKIIAARMAKFGINLCRIHLVDVEWQFGLFENSQNNTINISATKLDRLDYFIKCLKDKGIYFNFCIHAGRIFKEADGIEAPINNQQSKYSTLFNQKLIELQKDFALKTIGHINPYTGLSYAEDPAMAQVELTNENTLFNGWLGWNTDYIFGEKEGGIGPYYSAELDSRFNNWLAQKYSTNEELKIAWLGETSGNTNDLILNGSFEQNFSNWGKYVRSTDAIASQYIDPDTVLSGAKAAKTIIAKAGSQDWHVQLKTNEFKVEQNKSYKLRFFAKADSIRNMRLEIMENQTWKYISGPKFSISIDWKNYEVFFTSPFSSDNIIVQFEYGTSTGTFWLDEVSLTESVGIGLSPEENLDNKNISRTKFEEIGRHTAQRVADNAEFYFNLEKNYINQLSDYLKNDLNVKCPVTYTNNYHSLASVFSQSQADYMDFHMYWDHPSYINGFESFTMKNKAMVLDPEGSTINRMMLSKVKNKPFVLSEYNHPYPSIYQVEAPSLLYAYGSFFDLDGIAWHAYYDYMNRFSQKHQDMLFDIAMHPVMMTQMLLALPYRMNYIKKAQTWVEALYTAEDVFKNAKYFKDEQDVNFKNVDYGTSFLNHGFHHAGFTADSTQLSSDFSESGEIVSSETDELHWDGKAGVFNVNSPHWQGATGFLGSKTVQLENIILSNVSTSEDLDFAAIHLISLDSLPIDKSKKLILLTSARLENEGLLWNEAKTSLLERGGNRALCEPVECVLKFKNTSSDSIVIYALDQTGLRTDSIYPIQFGKDVRFSLKKKTLWYEVANHKLRSVPVKSSHHKNNPRSFKVYPNPGNLRSVVEYNFPGESKVRFHLTNALGQQLQCKEIRTTEAHQNKLEIDLAEFDPGVYFCGFELDNGQRMFKKLIVNN